MERLLSASYFNITYNPSRSLLSAVAMAMDADYKSCNHWLANVSVCVYPADWLNMLFTKGTWQCPSWIGLLCCLQSVHDCVLHGLVEYVVYKVYMTVSFMDWLNMLSTKCTWLCPSWIGWICCLQFLTSP